MSQARSNFPVEQKPKPNIYVTLLLVSTAAMLTGIIFLVLELNRYNWEVAP